MKGSNIHDSLFKEVYSKREYSLDIFKLVLSKTEFALFNWRTLKQDVSSFVDKHFVERRSDLIFSVKRKGSKEEVKIIFLLEHKSAQDPGLLQQLLEYQTRIYEKRKHPIIPILIYHGKEKDWRGHLNFQESLGMDEEISRRFGKNILQFRPRLLNLHKIRNIDLRHDLTSRPILFIMQSIFSVDEKAVENLFIIANNMDKKHGRELLERSINYLRKRYAGKFSWTFFTTAEEKVIPKRRRIMPTFKFTLEEEKEKERKKGRRQGRQEGRQEERERVALQMLKSGVEIDKICQFTELTPEEVEALGELVEA